MICPASDFTVGEPVEFRTKATDGREINVELRTRTIEVNLNPDISLPTDNFHIEVNSPEFEWLNGYSFDFALNDSMGLSVEYDRKEQKVTVGLNIDAVTWEQVKKNAGKDDDDDDEPYSFDTVQKFNNYTGTSMYKEITKAIEKEFNEAKNSKPDKFAPGKINIFVQGALEFDVKDDGKLELSGSSLSIGATFGIEWDTTFVVGVVPLTASVGVSSTMGVGTSFEHTVENYIPKIHMAEASLNLESEIELSIGVGVSVLSAGVYGSVGAESTIVLYSKTEPAGLKEAKIKGEFGVYFKFIFFEEKWPIVSGEFQLYPPKYSNDSVGKGYNPDLYTVNTDIMSLNPYWASPVATSVGTTTMLDNAYSGTSAQIAVCGNKAVMVYQGVDRNADNVANALSLYYSVYNPETMNWSVPKKLDSNQQADIDFTLVSNGDKAYVLYTQANSELSEDIGIFDVTKKIDVYSAEFDSSTETFSGFDRLTDDESYDTIPVIKTIGGSPTAVWTSNSEGSPFLSEGTNSIKLSKLENGEWSAPQTVVSTEDAIINCDVVASDRTPVVVYTTDADDDLVTADDRNLYVLNTANNESQTIAQGVTSAVEIGELMGNNVVMWYDNGEMKQYNAKTSAITSIDGIPSAAAKEFKIASDENGNNALVFVSEGTIYAKYLNTETGSWSEPIAVASSENNIENISAEYVNGKLNVTYYDTKVTDSESMATQSDLKTAVAANTPKPEITSASVDHENLVLGQEAEMQVTVRNSSSAPTGNLSFTVTNYDGTVLGNFTTENVSLNAGESQDFVVPFTVPDDIVNRDVKVTVTDSTKTGVSSKNVKLAVVDYGVNASQIYDGDKEYIKAVVYNNTNYTSPATLEVYNRFTDEVLYSTNISKVEKNYPVTAKIEIDNSYIDKNGYISVRIVTKAEDSFETDNTDMFQYIPKDAFDTPDLLIGDVNLDGEVDINDATEISKYLVNLITLEGKALATADVNGDADIDINDVTCIQKYLAKFTSYGNCGQKLTSRV
ncbi:MAG: dockerin type I domain-containing protein [Ruminococcus sp.]|nr:dockerin type I domain-containing protein [Ruminococcus sp.]